MPDPTEILTDWKAKTDAATEGPWEIHVSPGDRERPSEIRAYRVTTADAVGLVARDVLGDNALFIATARDAMPRLLVAIRAVRALHRPTTVGTRTMCRHCALPWPCATIRAIDAALGGSEPDERNE